MSSIPKLLVLALLACLMASCSYGPVSGPRRFNPATEPTLVPTSEAVAAPIYTIQQGTVTERLTFPARVSPRFETIAIAPVTGTILELAVSEGDFVAEGDRLAFYDFSSQEEEISQLNGAIADKQAILAKAQADIAADTGRAQIELDIATLEYEQALQNAGDNPAEAAQKQLDLLVRKIDLAKADLIRFDEEIDPDGLIAEEIALLREQISVLEEQMVVRSIFSPADGMILGLNIARSGRISAGHTVAVIGQMGGLDDLSVSTVLRSDALERLANDMPVTMVFASRPDEAIPGKIVRLPYPYNSGGNQLGFDPDDLAIRLLPDNPAILDELPLGERVEVSLQLDEKDNALWLPPEAIREFSDRMFVVVKNGEREQRIDVQVGLKGDGRVEVLGSLEAGQQVVGR